MARFVNSVSQFPWLHRRVSVLCHLRVLHPLAMGQVTRGRPTPRDSLWCFLETTHSPAISTLPDRLRGVSHWYGIDHGHQSYALLSLRCCDASADASQSRSIYLLQR